MRQLFSTFAHGAPGVGLLLIRLLAGTLLLARGAVALLSGPPIEAALLQGLSCALGLLLFAGLWTPLAGALIALYGFGSALVEPAGRWYSMIAAILGLALALLGPGAWSVDARLFGWRRLEPREQKRGSQTTASAKPRKVPNGSLSASSALPHKGAIK